MKKPILLVMLAFIFTASMWAQPANVAPIVWERYKIPEQKISVLLPKLPTATRTDDICREESKAWYFAYAAGVVYEVNIVSRFKKGSRPGWCTDSSTSFDLSRIERRLDEMREAKEKPAESVVDAGGMTSYRFTTDRSIRHIIPDLENRRWIELAIARYPDEKADGEEFFASLQLSEAGKEIGNGSRWTLGDPMPEKPAVDPPADTAPPATKTGEGNGEVSKPSDKPAAPPREITAVRIVSKPRASYTADARRANTQGTVRLKVPLMSNGSVGTPIALRKLDNGLTEEAMAAAQRVVFLPKRVNNVPVTVIMTFEYSFSIY